MTLSKGHVNIHFKTKSRTQFTGGVANRSKSEPMSLASLAHSNNSAVVVLASAFCSSFLFAPPAERASDHDEVLAPCRVRSASKISCNNANSSSSAIVLD
jgi:hypothetical protein